MYLHHQPFTQSAQVWPVVILICCFPTNFKAHISKWTCYVCSFLSLSNIMLQWWIPSIKHDHLAEFQNKYMKPEISLISPLQSYVLLVGCDSFFLFKPTQVTEEIRIMWEDFNFVMHLTFPLIVIAPFILCNFPLLTLFFVLFSVRVVLCWSSWTFPGVIKSRRMASRPWCAPALDSNVFSSRAAPRYTRDYVIISCWQFHSV